MGEKDLTLLSRHRGRARDATDTKTPAGHTSPLAESLDHSGSPSAGSTPSSQDQTFTEGQWVEIYRLGKWRLARYDAKYSNSPLDAYSVDAGNLRPATGVVVRRAGRFSPRGNEANGWYHRKSFGEKAKCPRELC